MELGNISQMEVQTPRRLCLMVQVQSNRERSIYLRSKEEEEESHLTPHASGH